MDSIIVLTRTAGEEKFDVPEGIRQLSSTAGRFTYSAKALWLAMGWRPDVVYCGHVFMAPLAYMVARLVGARLVLHVHGLEVWEPLSWWARKSVAASDVILCVSRHTAEKVVQTQGADPARCAVIYNTVDDHFVSGDRAQHGPALISRKPRSCCPR